MGVCTLSPALIEHQSPPPQEVSGMNCTCSFFFSRLMEGWSNHLRAVRWLVKRKHPFPPQRRWLQFLASRQNASDTTTKRNAMIYPSPLGGVLLSAVRSCRRHHTMDLPFRLPANMPQSQTPAPSVRCAVYLIKGLKLSVHRFLGWSPGKLLCNSI